MTVIVIIKLSGGYGIVVIHFWELKKVGMCYKEISLHSKSPAQFSLCLKWLEVEKVLSGECLSQNASIYQLKQNNRYFND